MNVLSQNAKAILLMTAPLIVGNSVRHEKLITPGEYKKIVRALIGLRRTPADLISNDADSLINQLVGVVDADRLKGLLGRGFQLSQACERWSNRGIWVLSRADAAYPKRLKRLLREDAPAVIFGCGNIENVELGGLAVVGSRNVDEELIEYTKRVGCLAARSGCQIVSGGARGIDRAAMDGVLDAGGWSCGILADSLERNIMNPSNREAIMEDRLTLISPYDPNAGFNVGNAMQRNKLIYALADAALVVNAEVNKGGTWAGAVEQLGKLKLTKVYVRSSGRHSDGLEELLRRGAIPWPNPDDEQSLKAVFHRSPVDVDAEDLFAENVSTPEMKISEGSWKVSSTSTQQEESIEDKKTAADSEVNCSVNVMMKVEKCSNGDKLFSFVRGLILPMSDKPLRDVDAAAALDVSVPQARAWLQRMVDEGDLEQQKRPVRYIRRTGALLAAVH